MEAGEDAIVDGCGGGKDQGEGEEEKGGRGGSGGGKWNTCCGKRIGHHRLSE